jgi:hypothetical protein
MSRAAMLDAYLTEVQARAFDWAGWNCCTFAAGWVQRATGARLMLGLPRTPSRLAAHRLIAQIGGTLRGVWSLWLRREPIEPALAQVGDIVGLSDEDAQAIGVCCGRTAAVLTEAGLCHVPMERAACAWRVEP